MPPTIWAYGQSRINKWKNLHDGLFCLFKNEEEIFIKNDVKCRYLGNPVIENFINIDKKRKEMSQESIGEQELADLKQALGKFK